MRLLADSNIVAQAVRALRAAGHDVAYAGERATDPGDQALLAEAADEGRIFVTKDHDIGTLVHRDLQPASQLVRDFMRDFVRRRREAREHDTWFREQVQEALDAPLAGIPHDAVMDETRAIIDRIAAAQAKA